MVGELAAIVVGLLVATWIMTSIIRTVVLPGPQRVWLTMLSFEVARRASNWLAKRIRLSTAIALLGGFAPTVFVLQPLLWSVGMICAFAAIFWGAGFGTFSESIELSGSSFTTLGISAPPDFPLSILVVVEALIGLSILGLMIGFLPTLYGTFSRREVAVGRLTTRAGSPPVPASFIGRLQVIGRIELIGDLWEDWEDWFVELGETHTTFPALIYFRSSHPERNWLAAAETALDTAALVAATKIIPPTGQADTMIRAGYIALRSIADFYRIEAELDESEMQRLSVQRSQFEQFLDELEAHGLQLERDRDDIWSDYAGWRLNYDRSVMGLRALIGFVPSHWDDVKGNQDALAANTDQ